MKLIITLIIVICFVPVICAAQYQSYAQTMHSYYGFSGMSFIPTAQIIPANTFKVTYSTKPNIGEELALNPYSLRAGYGLKKNNLEIGATNTPFYSSKREYGGVFLKQGVGDITVVLPIFPTIKHQFMPMTKPNHYVGMAVGVALPYGAYYVVDKYFDVRFMDITLTTGIGTKLSTYHTVFGATFTFGNRIGEIQRDFPIELLIEGSWGGSLKQLNEKEEVFFAITCRQAWTESLLMVAFFRVDRQPFVDAQSVIISESPTKRVGLGLDFAWR